jgi:hypothetical protein
MVTGLEAHVAPRHTRPPEREQPQQDERGTSWHRTLQALHCSPAAGTKKPTEPLARHQSPGQPGSTSLTVVVLLQSVGVLAPLLPAAASRLGRLATCRQGTCRGERARLLPDRQDRKSKEPTPVRRRLWVVGVLGFEPRTSSSQMKRAARLRFSPCQTSPFLHWAAMPGAQLAVKQGLPSRESTWTRSLPVSAT